MATKNYRVMRQIYDQQRFLNDNPQYRHCKIYMAELSDGSYHRSNHVLVTHEDLSNGQLLWLDEDKELLPLGDQNSSIQLSGNKAFHYRPQHMLSNTFTIKSMVRSPDSPIEKFGSREIAHADFYYYEVEQTAYGGYRGNLARLFTKALHFKGMEVPQDEVVKLPERKRNDVPHYFHETESRTYKDRINSGLKGVA